MFWGEYPQKIYTYIAAEMDLLFRKLLIIQ